MVLHGDIEKTAIQMIRYFLLLNNRMFIQIGVAVSYQKQVFFPIGQISRQPFLSIV
jgi:hypothetical protein